jgi:protein-S-isoprenylcysteine O-methyltransferase Ste14
MSLRGSVNTSPIGLTISWLVIALGLFFFSVEVSAVLRLPVVKALPLLDLGLVLVAFGFALRYSALRQLLTLNRSIQWSHEPGTLVVDGVFRFSRNPAYLGVLLMGIGALLTEVNLVMVAILIVLFVVLNRQASREEGILAKQFGESYLSYKKKTRRWL